MEKKYFEYGLRAWPEKAKQEMESSTVRGVGPSVLARRQSVIRAAGAIPIFLVMVERGPTPQLARDAEEAGLEHVIDLNHPDRYPELFERKHRFDVAHLNLEGARHASLILAAEIAEVVRGQFRARTAVEKPR